MGIIYNFSRNALLKKIGLSPGKKPLVFFISAVLITLPLGYAYNSIALILFVLYSLLSAKKENTGFTTALLLPMLLFGLMVISFIWSIDSNSTLKAISKEASLLFIPLAFCFNRNFIRMGVSSILKNFSIGMCLFGLYYIGRAIVRYVQTADPDVFFYHELATPAVNAIYLSALFSVPLFYFLSVKRKTLWDYAALVYLMVFIFMLSSKTVIITDVLLVMAYFVFYSGLKAKTKLIAVLLFFSLAMVLGYYGKIKDRLVTEYAPNAGMQDTDPAAVNNVSVKDAWTRPDFTPNDYFNGTAFRVYQIRVFTEIIQEDFVFFTGYGLNASLKKVEEKGLEHHVYQGDGLNKGYQKQNFHNQYVEVFADLGVFGFGLLVILLLANLKNSLKTKDFIHIAFAILMIALLLTESFLWRQRGVVFFTMLYCLFNGLRPKGFEKEKYEKNSHNRGSGIFRVTSL
jgi:O-antigen ligase